MTSPSIKTAPNKSKPGPGETLKPFNIYQHSSMIYWVVVWIYGLFCAAVTRLFGLPTTIGDKTILFYPYPALGISFIAVLLFVLTFTTVQARGVYSYMVLTLLALLVYFIPYAPGFESVARTFLELRVHLNLAFYLTFSLGLLALWIVVVILDRISWYKFAPGQVIQEHLFHQATDHVYATAGMTVQMLPADFFRNHFLGLRFLGLGTGDFIVIPVNQPPFELRNVLRPQKRLQEMRHMIALTRVTTGIDRS
jgi:hypothetical protein